MDDPFVWTLIMTVVRGTFGLAAIWLRRRDGGRGRGRRRAR
ncbi:MAG TPA: hypothetical protein VFU43_12720 [Streptosporangiaceae bacterium]|nr:hypothetical protein [Streptosporangiaceae bacterium]